MSEREKDFTSFYGLVKEDINGELPLNLACYKAVKKRGNGDW